MDDYKIDSHKLMYHSQRVADWLKYEDHRKMNIKDQCIYPIYVEISPSGACNHRCVFCAFDFMGYKKRYLDSDILHIRLWEMADLGVKAIHYAGEGEPLLHEGIADIVRHTVGTGIDVGISTNGVLLDGQLAEKLLPHCTWIKVSINAGRRKTYAKVHGCREIDFDNVIANMYKAARVRNDNKYECTLGFQMVVLSENESEVYLLTEKAHDIGVDYVVFKPYSQHPLSKKKCGSAISKSFQRNVSHAAFLEETEDFKVIFRERAFHRTTEDHRSYNRCLALPFWCYMDSEGGVWGCYRHIGNENFYYGNICRDSFKWIWDSSLQKRNSLTETFDISKCGINCRMDEINRYLWDLKHPGRHVNFI